MILNAHRLPVAILSLTGLRSPAEVRELSRNHPATNLVILATHPSSAERTQLHIGIETDCTHARKIYRKLGVSSRRELLAISGHARTG